MIITQARPRDIAEMVELGYKMWEEGAFKVTGEYNRDHCFEFALNAVEQQIMGGDFFVEIAQKEEGSPIVAMVIGQTVPYFVNRDKIYAVDHVVYVSKEFRGSSLAFRMTKRFEKWAMKRGAIELSLGVSTGIHPEKTHKFYTKMGYTHVGGIYKKPLGDN